MFVCGPSSQVVAVEVVAMASGLRTGSYLTTQRAGLATARCVSCPTQSSSLPSNESSLCRSPQIDIMEMVNGDGVLHGTYHWCSDKQCGNGKHHLSHHGQVTLPNNWSSEWHEYSVDYDGVSSVTFAIDGKEYVTTNTTVAPESLFWDTPYYIILNTAVGGPWPKPPNATTAFPTFHYIDSVRVAQPERQESSR